MNIYYLWDEGLRQEKNRRGENHWFTYMTELFSRLGVSGQPLLVEQVESTDFGAEDILFTGSDALPGSAVPAISKGLERGMTLIGFGTTGAGALFGVKTAGSLKRADDFTINGYFKIRKEAQDVYLPVPEETPPMPVFSAVRVSEAISAEVLADITLEGRTIPALVRRANAFYFSFDLTQTLWASAQGRPVYEGSGRFHVARVPDMRITPLDYDTTIAYGDYYLYIIQSILAGVKMPMLHRLPPDADGDVPDLMLFYAGDEDAVDPSVTLRASEIMFERGLPYHINLMPTGEDMRLVLSPAHYELIKSRGHELALHYNMAEGFPWNDFTEENFIKQHRAYLRQFGQASVSTVGHCLANKGWAERARYQQNLGIKGDGSRSGEYDPDDINAFNLYGFAFGTSYPMFFYDDSAHGNSKIDFTEAPIAYYEPRVGGKYADGKRKIDKCLDEAAYFGRIINLFTHPHYVTDNLDYDSSMTLAALDESIRHIKEKGYKVIHSTSDRVCLFWHGRSRSKITNYIRRENMITCRVECAAEDGLIIRFPIDRAAAVTVDGNPAKMVFKRVDGLLWLMVPVREIGGHIISITEESL